MTVGPCSPNQHRSTTNKPIIIPSARTATGPGRGLAGTCATLPCCGLACRRLAAVGSSSIPIHRRAALRKKKTRPFPSCRVDVPITDVFDTRHKGLNKMLGALLLAL